MQKATDRYQKWVYWLDPATHRDALDGLLQDKRLVYSAKHQPCEALYGRREIVLVGPEVWDRRCQRQGTWYRASDKRGRYLVVTNQPLKDLDLCGTITLEPFSPPRLATDEDVLDMMADERTRDVLPEGWGQFSPWELQAIQVYMKQEGFERSIQEIFFYYSANHLNFVFPRFFLEDRRNGLEPYSIQKTPLVCSACVELFGLLGESHPVKHVVPCPGLKYVKADPGMYLRVDTCRECPPAGCP